MNKEFTDSACELDMAPGLHDHPTYNKHFVRTKGVNKPGPSNHAAKECNHTDPAITIMMRD